ELRDRLRADASTANGRPAMLTDQVFGAVRERDGNTLDDLAFRYDQTVPDPDAAARIDALIDFEGPLVGYFGKLIVEKGAERVIEAGARLPEPARTAVIGFGRFREWLEALVVAIDEADDDAERWLADASDMQLEFDTLPPSRGTFRARITFTGRFDHRYAPLALAALDVQVVPSTLVEAFGMVAAEGASAGAFPLVARHSGLAEVAGALEGAIDRPGLLSFEPGLGATARLLAAMERILAIPPEERRELSSVLSAFVAREWTWERTAERLLAVAAR
ncbi:MAG: glycosyltransferase, partial [Actinomycetota bacterium]